MALKSLAFSFFIEAIHNDLAQKQISYITLAL
jgi:hypothetical protein